MSARPCPRCGGPVFGVYCGRCESVTESLTQSLNAAERHPVREAYDDADLTQRCSSCRAAAGDWCRRDDGRVKFVPCLARRKRSA